jgi:putative membrane protein
MKAKGMILGLMLALGMAGCRGGERSVQAARDEAVDAKTADRSDVLSVTEKDFVTATAKSHMTEIAMAEMAEYRSQNNTVKDFAGMLVKDHQAALEELKAIMKSHTIPEPANESSTDLLDGLVGVAFDREFLGIMVDKHLMGIAKYEAEGRVAENADLKRHIDGFVPKAHSHLKMAQNLLAKVGKGR